MSTHIAIIQARSVKINDAGFTIIELMIGIAVSAIAIAAMYVLYSGLQKSNVSQVQISSMQQNVRGVMTILEKEIRSAGMDRTLTKDFGFIDVRRYSVTGSDTEAVPDPAGVPAFRVTIDMNENGILDANETIAYLLYEKDNDGRRDFARAWDDGSGRNSLIEGRELLAESIEAIGFAYAFDRDNNGRIDYDGINIIWAVDSDNDGDLDSRLDANKDGFINIADVNGALAQDSNGDGVDDLMSIGAPLGYRVSPDRIRAVMIWILARTNREDRSFLNTDQYVVGDRVIGPMQDNFKRRLLSEMVNSRNL
jgi:type IV pilus assembly protein PilW